MDGGRGRDADVTAGGSGTAGRGPGGGGLAGSSANGGSSSGGTTGGSLAAGGTPGGVSAGGRPPTDASPGDGECDPAAPLPGGAPQLEKGVWVQITPSGVQTGSADTCLGQGIALDPCHPGTMYWSFVSFSVPGGIYKSTDGGATWRMLKGVDQPLHVRLDPKNPLHLYAGDGVRGGTLG